MLLILELSTPRVYRRERFIYICDKCNSIHKNVNSKTTHFENMYTPSYTFCFLFNHISKYKKDIFRVFMHNVMSYMESTCTVDRLQLLINFFTLGLHMDEIHERGKINFAFRILQITFMFTLPSADDVLILISDIDLLFMT